MGVLAGETIGVLGAGLIGGSWAALFLSEGATVRVFDPRPDAAASVARSIEAATPALLALGREAPEPKRLTIAASAADAVAGARFVQESAPERLPEKRRLYADAAKALAPDALVGSSTSGLTLTELQSGAPFADRLIIAHPFNPPHLIPLVELVGNDATAPGALDAAEAFYRRLGKETIRLKKEAPGHIANRLQAALWREAVHLAATGVASVEDVDRAVAAGPGLRWAALGPTSLFHLAAEDGIEGFCAHLGPSFEAWWDDLGAPKLDAPTVRTLSEGLAGRDDAAQLRAKRDETILAILAVKAR